MGTNITSKKFLDSIHGLKWSGLSIQNYWDSGSDGHNAVFLNYNGGFSNGGEYVKIYCDANFHKVPNLKIKIYLLNREYNNKRDFLLRIFTDWKEYKDYIENNIINEIKKLNNTKRMCYDD